MAEWRGAASAGGEGGGRGSADAGGAVERRGEWPGEADLREDVFGRVLEGEADQIVGGAALCDAGCGFADQLFGYDYFDAAVALLCVPGTLREYARVEGGE